jgi:hypothetical protein
MAEPPVPGGCLAAGAAAGLRYPQTWLCMEWQRADGTRRLQVLTAEQLDFQGLLYGGDRVGVALQGGPGAGDFSYLMFFAPPGLPLEAGNAYTANSRTVQAGLMEVLANGCSRNPGRFQVLDFAPNAEQNGPARFAANFEQECPGLQSVLRGTVLFNAGIGPDGRLLPGAPTPTPRPVTPTPVPVTLAAPECVAALARAGGSTALCLQHRDAVLLLRPQDGWQFFAQQPGTEVVFFPINGPLNRTIAFAAPMGRPLQKGVYEPATELFGITPDATRPALGVRSANDYAACSAGGGRFEVLELATATGTVTRFAANFEHYCDDPADLTRGTILFNATIGPNGAALPAP